MSLTKAEKKHRKQLKRNLKHNNEVGKLKIAGNKGLTWRKR